jgi:WD40 repeat protein
MPSQKITLDSAVLALDISPNGERIVVSQSIDTSSKARLTLWDVKNAQLLTEIDATEYDGMPVCFVGHDQLIAYAKNFSEVCLYSVETGEYIHLNSAGVTWLAASHTHRLVVAGMATEVWDTEAPERMWLMTDYIALDVLNLKPAVGDISLDGTKVAVAGINTTQALIFDLDRDEIIQTLDNAPAQAHWVSLSPNLRYLAVIGVLSQGRFLWNLETGERYLPDLFGPDSGGDWSMCFHPNGEYLATGSLVGFISIYRLQDGEIVFSEQIHEGRVWDLAFTRDGKKIISGGDDGVVSILELDNLN